MKRRVWLVAAVLLLVAAALLMLYSEEPRAQRPRAEVTFPRRLDRKQAERMRARQTLPAPPQLAGAPQGPARPRAPLLAAIGGGGGSAVIVEANALRNSPIGELLLACVMGGGRRNPIDELRERAGVDVLQDLDRVALTPHGVAFSGNFAKARWDGLLGEGATPATYGAQGRVYQLPREDDDGPGVLVTWGDQLVMLAPDDAQARAAVDRLEGRAPVVPVIGEEQTYGEIYGVLAAADLAKLLPPEQAELAARLREVAQRVELHVDATHDVGIVADVQGADPAQVEDLGRSVGGLLAAARVQATAEDKPELAEILELARVLQRDGAFVLEVGLPLELLAERLAGCREGVEGRTSK